jgi:hypothetical protein
VRKTHQRVRGETASQVVIPSNDPPAEICDLHFTKLIFGKVFVREDADASEMIQDRFEVEAGFMTAGKTLEVDVGEGAGGCVQVDGRLSSWRTRPSMI